MRFEDEGYVVPPPPELASPRTVPDEYRWELWIPHEAGDEAATRIFDAIDSELKAMNALLPSPIATPHSSVKVVFLGKHPGAPTADHLS